MTASGSTPWASSTGAVAGTETIVLGYPAHWYWMRCESLLAVAT